MLFVTDVLAPPYDSNFTVMFFFYSRFITFIPPILLSIVRHGVIDPLSGFYLVVFDILLPTSLSRCLAIDASKIFILLVVSCCFVRLLRNLTRHYGTIEQ